MYVFSSQCECCMLLHNKLYLCRPLFYVQALMDALVQDGICILNREKAYRRRVMTACNAFRR